MPYPLESPNDGSIADRNFQNLAKDMNPPVPQARVYNSAAIATVTAVTKLLTFDSERFDNGGLHSTAANTSRLTAPIAGLYEIGASIEWGNVAGGARSMFLQLNGAAVIAANNLAAIATSQHTLSTIYQLAAGDYVEVQATQTSGGNLNVNASASYSPEFWMVRLGGYVNQGV